MDSRSRHFGGGNKHEIQLFQQQGKGAVKYNAAEELAQVALVRTIMCRIQCNIHNRMDLQQLTNRFTNYPFCELFVLLCIKYICTMYIM